MGAIVEVIEPISHAVPPTRKTVAFLPLISAISGVVLYEKLRTGHIIMMQWPAALALITLMCASASATDLVTEPEAAMYLQPPTSNGQLQTIIGDQSVLNPSWSIIQQGSPTTIPAGSGQNYTFPQGTSWQVSQGSSFRVQFNSTAVGNSPEHTYELAQNSSNAACTGNPGNEWDLIAQTIPPGPPYGSGYKFSNGSQVPSRTSRSAPLNSISNVIVQVGLAVPYEVIGTGCAVNANGYSVGLGIRNVSQGLFIFYYISFRDSRGYLADRNPCYSPNPTSGNYCFNTSAQYIGGPPGNQAVSSNRIYYTLNAYNDIAYIIKNSTSDSNLADWTIEGSATFGPGSVGQVSNVSDWDSFKLSTY